jgi:hypothetical protein
VPFVIILRMSLSDPASAQPPYRPLLDWSQGWAGIRLFIEGLDLENYATILTDPLYASAFLTSVRIAATGGAEAAAEVRKVESAVAGLGTQSGAAASGVDELRERMEKTAAEARALAEDYKELGEEVENNTKRNNVARASAVGLGIGGAIHHQAHCALFIVLKQINE